MRKKKKKEKQTKQKVRKRLQSEGEGGAFKSTANLRILSNYNSVGNKRDNQSLVVFWSCTSNVKEASQINDPEYRWHLIKVKSISDNCRARNELRASLNSEIQIQGN